MKCRSCRRTLVGPPNKRYCDKDCLLAWLRNRYAKNVNGIRDEIRARNRAYMKTERARRLTKISRAKCRAEGRIPWYQRGAREIAPSLARLRRAYNTFWTRVAHGTASAEDARGLARLRKLMKDYSRAPADLAGADSKRLLAELDAIAPRGDDRRSRPRV